MNWINDPRVLSLGITTVVVAVLGGGAYIAWAFTKHMFQPTGVGVDDNKDDAINDAIAEVEVGNRS